MMSYERLLQRAGDMVADVGLYPRVEDASDFLVQDTAYDLPQVLPVLPFTEEALDRENTEQTELARKYLFASGVHRLMPTIAHFGHFNGPTEPIACLPWVMDPQTLALGLPDVHLVHRHLAPGAIALENEVEEPMALKHTVVSGYIFMDVELAATAVLRHHVALPTTHMEALDRVAEKIPPVTWLVIEKPVLADSSD